MTWTFFKATIEEGTTVRIINFVFAFNAKTNYLPTKRLRHIINTYEFWLMFLSLSPSLPLFVSVFVCVSLCPPLVLTLIENSSFFPTLKTIFSLLIVSIFYSFYILLSYAYAIPDCSSLCSLACLVYYFFIYSFYLP